MLYVVVNVLNFFDNFPTRAEKHKTERAKQESYIDTVAGAQTMEYIAPAKKIRY